MEGQVLASTEKQPESLGAEVAAFITSPADSQVVHGYQFFKVFDENQLEYILLAKGSNDDVYMVGKMEMCIRDSVCSLSIFTKQELVRRLRTCSVR